MAVPHLFGNESGFIKRDYLDDNFAALYALTYSTGVSVLQYVPAPLIPGILARAPAPVDMAVYINQSIAENAITLLPNGAMTCLFPINMTNRGETNETGSFSGRSLIGAGQNLTQLNCYPGDFACLDRTGSANTLIKGFNIRSDNPGVVGLGGAACASVGVFDCRGNSDVFARSGSFNDMQDIRINMTSNVARNGGNGTRGYVNIGTEHGSCRQNIQIYANVPFTMQNVAQFTLPDSTTLGLTGGSPFEPKYSGSGISCTIFDMQGLQLIAYDSYRCMDLWQIAGAHFPAMYHSQRKLVGGAPFGLETIRLAGSNANIFGDAYQETSGKFGATYLMDSRYLTAQGSNDQCRFIIQRGPADIGFANPGTPQPSVFLEANSTLRNSFIQTNYTIGTYNNSGDNNGFAALPVVVTGAGCQLTNVDFDLDHSGSHSADIFSAIGPYCINVNSRNYFSGDDYYGNSASDWTPTIVGFTLAGVGTYTRQIGKLRKNGRMATLTIDLAWTAHTGTGIMTVQVAPLPSAGLAQAAGSIDYVLNGGAGKQITAVMPQSGSTTIFLHACDPAGGAQANIAMQGTGTLLLSVSYPI